MEMIEQAVAGKLKGMLIMGENPLSSFPYPSLVRKALASLEFLVVADMFLTETAKMAAVVLPVASFAEKEGTFTNFEGRVQRLQKAIEPLGDSLPDWEIVFRIADRMQHPMPYSSPQDILDEIEALVPTYQRLADTDFEVEEVTWTEMESERIRTRRLYQGPFTSGFGRFAAVKYIPAAEISGNGYPLTLLTGSVLPHFGSGTRSLRSSRLRRFLPHACVEINEADIGQLGFSDGEVVRVVSPVGEVTAAVKLTNSLPPGVLFMPISFPESPVNGLFGISLDPQAKAPSLKTCSVKLERIKTDG